jgi:hypothetical protein
MKKLLAILILCSSCGVTVKVQGVAVRSPQKSITPKEIRNGIIIGLVGYGLTRQLVSPQDREKMLKKLKSIK